MPGHNAVMSFPLGSLLGGDPAASEFHFCGRGPKAGSPYCEAHARKAYQPQQQRRDKDKGRLAG